MKKSRFVAGMLMAGALTTGCSVFEHSNESLYVQNEPSVDSKVALPDGVEVFVDEPCTNGSIAWRAQRVGSQIKLHLVGKMANLPAQPSQETKYNDILVLIKPGYENNHNYMVTDDKAYQDKLIAGGDFATVDLEFSASVGTIMTENYVGTSDESTIVGVYANGCDDGGLTNTIVVWPGQNGADPTLTIGRDLDFTTAVNHELTTN